jgi:hypothetical protein
MVRPQLRRSKGALTPNSSLGGRITLEELWKTRRQLVGGGNPLPGMETNPGRAGGKRKSADEKNIHREPA